MSDPTPPVPMLDDGDVVLHLGDCVEVMAAMPAESVDAIVCDPPYGLEFMGRDWDSFRVDDRNVRGYNGRETGKAGELAERDGATLGGRLRVGYGGGSRAKTSRCEGCGKRDQFRKPHACPEGTNWRSEIIDPHAAPPSMLAFQEWCETWATEALRVLKPGGHMLAFGGTRTFHRLTCAIEDAGFEIRDSIGYGHMRHVYCQCSPLPYNHAESAMRGVRDTGPSGSEPTSPDDHDDLLVSVQRGPERTGVGDPRGEGPIGVDGRLAGVVPGEDERSGEPGMEGRGDRLAQGGELPSDQVRPRTRVGASDGPEGRLRHGAPAAHGDDVRLPPDEDGGGASPGPRPDEQRPDEPGGLAVEWIPQGGGAWPACPRCHLPLAPPFDAGPLAWEYGSGFPKSLDVSKAIEEHRFREWLAEHPGHQAQLLESAALIRQADDEDALARIRASHDALEADLRRLAGVAREHHGTDPAKLARRPMPWGGGANGDNTYGDFAGGEAAAAITSPTHPDAQRWDGWGTALKPAWEPIVVARKPLAGTVAANVIAHGTGALNIDGCRIGTTDDLNGGAYSGDRRDGRGVAMRSSLGRGVGEYEQPAGRWPANVVLDEAAAAQLDAEVGERPSGRHSDGEVRSSLGGNGTTHGAMAGVVGSWHGDTGGPSRFFYTAKASTAEREGATHPTVKPLALMRWCVRLVTPPGGVVLDCFAGSGTTLLAARDEGFRAIGIEREEEYARMILERYRRRFDPAAASWDTGERGDDDSQLSLLA